MNTRPDNSTLYTFLSLGVFVGGCGTLLMFAHPPDSAEFVVSACSSVMGLALVVGALAVSRWLAKRT
jgi:hypothetical protein